MGEDKFPDLERRKIPRLRDNIFICGCASSNPIEEFKAITNDISAGGLMFELERDITPESKLELEIYQPGNRDKIIFFSIHCLARVAWIKRLERENLEQGENKYRMGIEFLEIKQEDRQRVAKFISEGI